VRIDQYALVPAGGGVLAVDGRLPHVQDDWEIASLAALLPPTRYLRLVAHVEVAPRHFLRLRAFDRVDAAGTLDVDVPEPLRAAFDRSLAEANGVPPPPRRPSWTLPGWHDEAEAWAGATLELVRSWPLSYVARAGGAYFKAVFSRFLHEPAVTAALGSPQVLPADHERGWMLLEPLAGTDTDHHTAMRAIAAVHRGWASRVDEALALGALDRRAPSELPHTLVHGDFHPGNILGGTIIDWSDSAVANPLHDVNHYAMNVDASLRDELIATYAEAWPGHDVAAAAARCEAESYEYVAESYRAITDALADDDRWWFEATEPDWLRRASDVRAGRRPSRDT
jgi:hypothetical protein